LLYIDQTRAVFWFRMMTSAGFFASLSIYIFARATIKVKNWWGTLGVILSVIVIGFTLLTNLFTESVSVIEGYIIYDLAETWAILAGPSSIFIIISLITLVRSSQKTSDQIQKNRLMYLIIGILVMIVGSSINIIYPPLGGYPIDIVANMVTALIIGYAILRYQLLDIRIVIRQGLLYSIPTVLIGTAYFLIITLFINIFGLFSGAGVYLTSLVVAVITALLAEPLRIRAQAIIDRIFFREKYDSRVMLQTLSSQATSTLDLYKITNTILSEVGTTLHLLRAAFFFRDEDTGMFQLTTQIGLDELGNQSFRHGHPLVLWFFDQSNPISRQDMELLPQFQSLWKNERQLLKDMKAELFIPIKVLSQLVGIFILGPKRSEQPYDSEEIITLTTVANQTAAAIENARLYTEEQSRRKEIDTLYSLSNQLVDTDDLETILNIITKHTVENVQVTYARVLIRDDSGDYHCRAIYPINNLLDPLRYGKVEPIVAEYFYDMVLENEKIVVVDKNDPDWHDEEKQALFINYARTLCICPLIGAGGEIGLLILGEFHSSAAAPFSPSQLRLIGAIADYASSSIQRAILHERLEETFLETIIALANAVDARDTYTGDHSHRMAELSTRIGNVMDLPKDDIEDLRWATILHDIGKIGVPDEILNKKGALTKKEWVVMKEHPVTGAQIVSPVKHLARVAPIIQSHHEKYDGTGYPYGLEGEDIPLGSRILAVVDAYTAIRDKRIYSKAHTHEEAIAELRRFSGTQFDPIIVDVFCKTITE
ncbi:MAG: HD domain-containing protein, partial [Anaerolineales bacterium]|nr:HD domain-containing protein [Anaerolineales bacterium]